MAADQATKGDGKAEGAALEAELAAVPINKVDAAPEPVGG